MKNNTKSEETDGSMSGTEFWDMVSVSGDFWFYLFFYYVFMFISTGKWLADGVMEESVKGS